MDLANRLRKIAKIRNQPTKPGGAVIDLVFDTNSVSMALQRDKIISTAIKIKEDFPTAAIRYFFFVKNGVEQNSLIQTTEDFLPPSEDAKRIDPSVLVGDDDPNNHLIIEFTNGINHRLEVPQIELQWQERAFFMIGSLLPKKYPTSIKCANLYVSYNDDDVIIQEGPHVQPISAQDIIPLIDNKSPVEFLSSLRNFLFDHSTVRAQDHSWLRRAVAEGNPQALIEETGEEATQFKGKFLINSLLHRWDHDFYLLNYFLCMKPEVLTIKNMQQVQNWMLENLDPKRTSSPNTVYDDQFRINQLTRLLCCGMFSYTGNSIFDPTAVMEIRSKNLRTDYVGMSEIPDIQSFAQKFYGLLDRPFYMNILESTPANVRPEYIPALGLLKPKQ